MMDREESNRRWAAVQEAADAEQFDKALEILHEWESMDRLSIEELVQKGILIQLSETLDYELEDAKEAFIRGLGRDKNYPDALIELGHFCWVMEDDAKQGLKHFDEAIAVLEEMLGKARAGRQECLEESQTVPTTTGDDPTRSSIR